MTVRAWFTISAIAAIALGAAFAWRLFRPIEAPELVVRSGDVRLSALHLESCWPQGSGEPRCLTNDTDPADRARSGDGADVPAAGRFEVFAAYPVQPADGRVLIQDARTGDVIDRSDFDDIVDYDVGPGDYVLRVEARWEQDAFVRYAFPFTVVG